jgi:NAD(P)-dependent dehydrogenase (short-subunit alcohol dehydrogenase family)
MECPAHCYRSIEYPRSASLQDYVSMVREWLQQSTTDLVPAQMPMVRYREGARYVTALTELAEPAPIEMPAQFRRGATYLMVGALGEVGQIVCRALARVYRPRLVILSRRALDADVRQRLAGISDAGAEVIYRSVDITDEGRLAETFGAIKNEVGAIQGVFHFARSVSDGLLLSKDIASFQRTIAAKVAGALNIDKATAGEPLDFFIAYSSMASFGIEGSADYGYATAFQNAFVRHRNRLVERGERKGRSLALCWGQWEADAYSTAQRVAVMRQRGFDVIDAASALPLMEATLQERGEVVGIVAVTDKQNVRQLYGLSALKSPPVTALVSTVENKFEIASLEKYLANDGLKANGSRNAVRQVLLEKSDAELAELYEALTD